MLMREWAKVRNDLFESKQRICPLNRDQQKLREKEKGRQEF